VTKKSPGHPARPRSAAHIPSGRARRPRRAAKNPHAALDILEKLRATYPDAHCELDFRDPFQLLIATILSAQCTDVRVNMVTPSLFKKYPDAPRMASASQDDIETLIRSTGFYRNKAKNIRAASAALVENHGGHVPRELDALTILPGVGRKTANVVLGNAYGIEAGIVVDTHVVRLSKRLGLTKHSDPVKIERDLIKVIPQKDWTLWSHLLIWHGRRRCSARKPDCAHCELAPLCPSAGKC
jgi:endonuclease-3